MKLKKIFYGLSVLTIAAAAYTLIFYFVVWISGIEASLSNYITVYLILVGLTMIKNRKSIISKSTTLITLIIKLIKLKMQRKTNA